MPGVPKDCSGRTASAGKSPSDAGGPWGAVSDGSVTLPGSCLGVNAQADQIPRGAAPGRTRPQRSGIGRAGRGSPAGAWRPPTAGWTPAALPVSGHLTRSFARPRGDTERWHAENHSGSPHATRCPGYNGLSAPALRQSEPPLGACAVRGPPRSTAVTRMTDHMVLPRCCTAVTRP